MTWLILSASLQSMLPNKALNALRRSTRSGRDYPVTIFYSEEDGGYIKTVSRQSNIRTDTERITRST
jgi:hypothetical protein